jgi:hypothetical protein
MLRFLIRILQRLFGKGKTQMNQARPELPSPLWLADAPLFIDDDQVARFYDAIARPQSKDGTTTVEIASETIRELSGKLGLEAGLTTEKLAGLLLPLLAVVKPSAKINAEGEVAKKSSEGSSVSIELIPVESPQRQLEALTLLYLAKHPKRIFFADFQSSANWRDPKSISAVPRSLVFLDLPGREEAVERGSVQTKLIPMAAEFENGKVVQIYQDLLAVNGERPPRYVDRSEKPEQLAEERKRYWQWFEKNFSAVTALIAIEKAASENGRIRWIDYRLALTTNGDTLHLHICPRGAYDTGVLAYNFVKRGSTHGLRLVGTLKSEPDLNVLAVYEK